MQMQKNSPDLLTSKETPRGRSERMERFMSVVHNSHELKLGEKKGYLKRKAEDVEQAELIEEWLKYKEDDKDGLRE